MINVASIVIPSRSLHLACGLLSSPGHLAPRPSMNVFQMYCKAAQCASVGHGNVSLSTKFIKLPISDFAAINNLILRTKQPFPPEHVERVVDNLFRHWKYPQSSGSDSLHALFSTIREQHPKVVLLKMLHECRDHTARGSQTFWTEFAKSVMLNLTHLSEPELALAIDAAPQQPSSFSPYDSSATTNSSALIFTRDEVIAACKHLSQEAPSAAWHAAKAMMDHASAQLDNHSEAAQQYRNLVGILPHLEEVQFCHGRKEGRFTHPWQPARLIGWNSVWVGQCDISAMTSCQGRL